MSSELQVHAPPKIGPYLFQGTIGEGAFSIVKLVQHKETRQYYACKIVPRSRIQTDHLKTRFEAEIRINQQLHFPGIVEMYDLLHDSENYYIVMEFCPNGELFQFIVDRQHLSETEAQQIFRQILETLEYIHSMGVSHRDMKPENLLIDQLGHIKISDFGLSRFLKQDGLVDTPCGSPCYASPECISGKSYDGITTDVWSSGVILYAMLTGQLPWTKRNQTQLFQQIKKGDYSIPTYLSSDCADFIQRLLTVDNKKRITIPQAYQHPWMIKTPPCLQYLPFPKSGVSIRMVDEFFGLVMSKLDLPRTVLERNISAKTFSFKKALRQIGAGDNLPRIRKRKKKVLQGTTEKGKGDQQSGVTSSRAKNLGSKNMTINEQVTQQADKTRQQASRGSIISSRPKVGHLRSNSSRPVTAAGKPVKSGKSPKAVVKKPHPKKSVL